MQVEARFGNYVHEIKTFDVIRKNYHYDGKSIEVNEQTWRHDAVTVQLELWHKSVVDPDVGFVDCQIVMFGLFSDEFGIGPVSHPVVIATESNLWHYK